MGSISYRRRGAWESYGAWLAGFADQSPDATFDPLLRTLLEVTENHADDPAEDDRRHRLP